ncbi:MAG TPA: hypothetical protein VJH24_03055 [Candidatus Bilamarchaeaceae archaeon]|nr:hypothetical protein [Candidatus Bilamarchaeaceae archaeon]
MARPEEYEGKTVYACEICGFAYAEKRYAEKCEAHCKKYNGCSLEITKHALRKH